MQGKINHSKAKSTIPRQQIPKALNQPREDRKLVDKAHDLSDTSKDNDEEWSVPPQNNHIGHTYTAGISAIQYEN